MAGPLTTPLRRMAAYNAWANGRLYEACARLPDEAYFAARPAFFGSIHRTLNHVLVADRIWLARLGGEVPPQTPLDAELYEGRADLRAAREHEDGRIVEHVAGLSEADLAADVSYENTRGEPFTQPRGLILQHVFNHQTHHRGQVHDMLSATSIAPPPLDLMVFAREPLVQVSTS